ncbi:MAG TPA: bifunctional nicotinamidase/pyrazinamidase [Geobacteraceae bacterium]
MEERAVLLVVDMQVDFCPGGSLAVPGGDDIIPVINRYIEIFQHQGVPIFVSRDWHPPVTTHFKAYGGLWPSHCVQGSAGAQFHPLLRLPDDVTVISKGMDPHKDDYSTFHALSDAGYYLDDHLTGAGVTRIYICGLATDYCVRQSSLDALRAGYAVTVFTDAVKGVDLAPGDSQRALEEISRAGAELTDLEEIEKRFGR